MAVHVPLSAEAQAEARLLMLSAHNILNPKDGRPVASPTQDMVLGSYYLTMERQGAAGEGKVFKDIDEAILAYDSGNVHLQARIKVRYNGELIETTVGRLIFNTVIPSVVGFVNEVAGKKTLGDIVAKTYRWGIRGNGFFAGRDQSSGVQVFYQAALHWPCRYSGSGGKKHIFLKKLTAW